jgi:anti-sigma factor RsiW
MNRVSKTDQSLVNRFVDGEMEGAELQSFEGRLEQDAALRAAEAETRQQSQSIRASDPLPASATAPAGFATKVLDSVRRMPSREDLVAQCAEEDATAGALGYARHLLVAAAVICGLALLFSLKALVVTDTGSLQASDQELEALDKKVKEMKTTEFQRLRQNR